MPKVGILLINTGTADGPTEEDIRRYLEEFLTDTMLFSAPPAIWKQIVRRFILPNRPKQTAPKYHKMWTEDGFVFNIVSQQQRDAVEQLLAERGFNNGNFAVEIGMRYGNPSTMSRLQALRDAECELLVAVPLYPQCVTVCAGTCLAQVDRCREELALEGWTPDLIRVWDFYEQPAYIEAMARSIQERWEYKPGSKLVYCWHSTLMADMELGDPYQEQCEATARMVSERLGIPDDAWTIAYQSRFDSRKWLQPFCKDVMPELGEQGITDVCACCPGFVADNMENVVETGEELRDAYLQAAAPGSSYTFVPALNTASGLIEAIVDEIYAAMRRGIVESVVVKDGVVESQALESRHRE